MGRGQGRNRAEALRSALSDATRVEVVETTHRGAATELAATHADEFDRVIAVGGDGTLNEVVCGLMQTGLEAQDLPELGFLPSGTANAAVRAFGGVLVKDADPFDGHLDVLGSPRVGVPGLLGLAARTLTSSLTKAKGVRHRPATRVALTSEGEVPFHLDGEPVGTLPAVATLRSGAVRFLRT